MFPHLSEPDAASQAKYVTATVKPFLFQIYSYIQTTRLKKLDC